jgi:hypothetical protein
LCWTGPQNGADLKALAALRRDKAMKLPTPPSPGRAYTAEEKARMLGQAAKLRSKNIYPALIVGLNCGLRDKELRELTWRQQAVMVSPLAVVQ